MIEPTDEMVHAYAEAWRERLFKEPQDQERPAVRAGLAAALAIVERDYDLHPKLIRTRPAPPDPCPFCTTGLAPYCPWHADAADIP